MKKTLRPLAASSCISIAAIIFLFSGFSFGQGNSGNNGNGQGNGSTSLTTGGSGKPPVSSLGLGKLPMWGLSGNSTDSTAIFGTTNDMPVKVVVNNIHRGSFTNTGFEIYGNSYSTSSTIDSILTAWQVMVNDALSVAGNLSVSGNASVSGFLMAGQITINGNSVTSSSGNIDLGNNALSTSGTITGSNITSLSDDVSGLQVTTVNQQAEIDSLQTTVSNIKSSQWQNDTVNPSRIFYSSGNVGIGTSEPSVPLEVSGSIKITGTDTTGSGGGGGGGGIPPPAPSRSIIIDGGLDRITATSGTLDFVNTNLTTTGNLQTNSITTTNITITDFIKTKSAEFDTLKVAERFEAEQYIQSDTMHALKSLEVNNSLRLSRDTSVMYAEMSTKDTAVALMLQKDAAAPVVIGDAPAPPPGESRAKLTVAGNTKLDGQLHVSGDITSAGTLNVNNIAVSNDFTANKIISNRITSTDSILWIGDSSLGFMGNVNRIIGSTSGFYRGLGLGVNATVRGLRSTAIGKNVKTEVDGENAVVIGSGMGNTETTLLTNNIPNSLMVGFNTSGNAPTLFVGPADGTANSIGEVGIGTSNPEAKLDIRVPSSSGNQFAAMFKTTNNDGIFIVPKLDEDGFNYHSKAGDAGIFWDGYNPQSGLVIGPWYSDGWRGLRISNEGLIGIGTSDPSEKLQIEDGSIYIKGESQGVIIDDGANKRVGLIKYPGHEAGIWRTTGQNFEIGRVNISSLPGSPTSFITDLLIGGDGNVSIGTTTPQSKLHVYGGNIRIENPSGFWANGWKNAIETQMGYVWKTTDASTVNGKHYGMGVTNAGWYWITADAAGATQNYKYPMTLTFDACGKPTLTVQEDKWCDFVYDENYRRMTYEEQESYWKKHKHLFGVAPEKDIIENGLDITGTMKGFALNIEEVRMDAVDLHKRLLLTEQKNIELQKKLDEQQKQIDELKNAIVNFKRN